MQKVTSINKAWLGGIVAAIVPYILNDLLQLQMPPEVLMAVNGVVVAIAVWAIPNVQKAIDG